MNESTVTVTPTPAPPDALAQENKIVIVVDPALGRGATDNRSAVMATGLTAKHPEIIGSALVTADGQEIAGFTKVPIAVLTAKEGMSLRDLAARAWDLGCTCLVFLARAQGMRSYEEYRASVARSASGDLDIDACLIYGGRKQVNKLVGSLPALR